MFGLGKKKTEAVDKPAKKTSSKKSSGEGFDWKAWLINHIEKIGLGLFAILAAYFVYDGFMTPPYERSKTPEVLASRSQAAKTEIETGSHWNEIKAERPIPNDFRKIVQDARANTVNTPYDTTDLVIKGKRTSGGKRDDPELLAPIEVQGTSFDGTIASYSATPSNLDKLLNAPPMGDGKKRREQPNGSTPPRQLNAYFDRGFAAESGTVFPPPAAPAPVGRIARPVVFTPTPKLTLFNAVTAVVPHRDMDENYRQAFGSATGFDLDRDTPNYLYYEVQRVEVTDNPLRTVDESEWKEALDCMAARQLKERSNWVGVCPEFVVPKYVYYDVLTMPVPPILLYDFSRYAVHPLVETAESASAVSGGAEESSDGSEGGTRPRGFAVPVNLAGPVASATPTTSSGDGEIADTDLLPKSLEMATYKLVRFYDFGVEGVGRVYRYRIRLALEDPNYTRAESVSPLTIDMNPEVIERVQALADADQEARAKLAPGQSFQRNSKRFTPWSQPSAPVAVSVPVNLQAGPINGLFVRQKTSAGKEIWTEQISISSPIIYGEWNRDDAAMVAHKAVVERGSVLSTPPEPGLDLIHPITKVIKWLTGFRFSQPVTVVDIRGGQPLEAERTRAREKDLLPSQTEIVGYDPRSGDLIISREFEAFRDYNMFSFVGETQASVGNAEEPNN